MAQNISAKKISLWISGNQVRSKGFEDLVLIKPQFPALTYTGIPGVEACQYAFAVKIGPNYTQYTIIPNKITTADGVPNGVLKIAIGIPAQHRIVGGISPYRVLMELKDLFFNTYMQPTLGVDGGFKHKDERPNAALFEQVLDKYQLETIDAPHRPMSGQETGLLILSENEIEKLFCDVQYNEFNRFSEVIVASAANESAYLGKTVSVTVPRKPQYQLYLNGRQHKWPVTDIYNTPSTLNANPDTQCYETAEVTFTLNELLTGKIPSGVKIDTVNEVVSVTLTPKEKVKTFHVTVNGEVNPTQTAKLRFKLDDGTPLWVGSDGTFTLRGTQLGRGLNIYTGDSRLEIVSRNKTGDTINIVTKVKEIVPPAPKHPIVSGGGNSKPADFAKQYGQGNNNNKKTLMIGIIIGVVVALLAAGAAAYFLFFNDKKDKSEEPENVVIPNGEENKKEKEEKEKPLTLDDFKKLFNNSVEDYDFDELDRYAREWEKYMNDLKKEPLIDEKDKKEVDDLDKEIKGLKNAADIIRNEGDWQKLKDLVDKKEIRNQNIVIWLNNAWKGGLDDKGFVYYGEGKPAQQRAKDLLKRDHDKYQKFSDLNNIHNEALGRTKAEPEEPAKPSPEKQNVDKNVKPGDDKGGNAPGANPNQKNGKTGATGVKDQNTEATQEREDH